MQKNCFLFVLSASLFSGSVLAGTMGFAAQRTDWVSTFSAGPVWTSASQVRIFYLVPETQKTYVADKSNSVLFDGEVFLGLQRILTQRIHAQFGLALAATSNANLSGVIWDDADPEFDNYIYAYKIQHAHVAAKGKFLANSGYWLIPWVSGSLGVGFNYAHSFSNTPTIFEVIANPNFVSHTQTSFTYTVGAGVQKALTQNCQIGVGYEFADWGKSSLGRAPGQTMSNGLTLSHLYTNGVLFNLTYLA